MIIRTWAMTGFTVMWRATSSPSIPGMSMSNNIAEGSGSSYKKEFKSFLNIARRSTFENANILIILERRNLINTERLDKNLDDLDKLGRQITNFRKSIK